MSDEVKAALFELYCWKFSNTKCFSNMLFDLIVKSDLSNQRRIAKGFPEYVEAFRIWQERGTEWLQKRSWETK